MRSKEAPIRRVAGLFAGIGGLELGFSQAGLQTTLLADSDPAAAAVLGARFPDVDILGDVSAIEDLPSDIDIVAAGFPCQNLSMAGDKAGIGGAKSTVVDELFRILQRRRVPIVVVENVYFMLHLARGRAMDHVVHGFEELGYRWAYRVLDTMGFGLPQRRRRVFLVASNTIDPRQVLFADEYGSLQLEKPSVKKPIGFYWTEGKSGVGLAADAIPPLKSGSAIGIPSAPAVLFPGGKVYTPGIETSEALQGFPRGWTEPADEVTKRARWRLVGNAVSVPVAAWIAGRILKPGDCLAFETRPLRKGDPWPVAAYNIEGDRIVVDASPWPIESNVPSLSDFVDGGWVSLSDRALRGFLRRAEEGRLKFPIGFLEALRAELAWRSEKVEA